MHECAHSCIYMAVPFARICVPFRARGIDVECGEISQETANIFEFLANFPGIFLMVVGYGVRSKFQS
jgi:hypothetical protein